MIDARPALNRLGISETSVVHAVQQVRLYVEEGHEVDQIARVNNLLDKVVGVQLTNEEINIDIKSTPVEYAVTVAQSVIEHVIKSGGVVEDVADVIEKAKTRAQEFINKPTHNWMFVHAEPEDMSANNTTVTSSVDVKVAVNSSGKIKKGGKEIIAVALYEKFVKNAEKPLDNKGFVGLLMSELGMSKNGANTYSYNMRKKFKTT